jgi:hypothetical protein
MGSLGAAKASNSASNRGTHHIQLDAFAALGCPSGCIPEIKNVSSIAHYVNREPHGNRHPPESKLFSHMCKTKAHTAYQFPISKSIFK